MKIFSADGGFVTVAYSWAMARKKTGNSGDFRLSHRTLKG
ncbi:MAG: hypothetical protein ACJAVM_000002 [Sulfitobacter sp.]|jgi:hypothetical protein